MRDANGFARDIAKKDARVFSVSFSENVPAGVVLLEELKEYSDVFEYDVSDLKRVDGAEHAIVLEPGTRAPFRPLYNMSENELALLCEYID